MSDRTLTQIAWTAWTAVALLTIATGVLHILNGPRGWRYEYGLPGGGALAQLGIATAGVVIAVRQPRNRIGWIFIIAGAALTISYAGPQYAIRAVYTAPGSLPAPLIAAWLGSWANVVSVPLMVIFLPLLFPSGRLPSSRWRIPAWIIAGLSVAWVISAAIPPSNVAPSVQADGSLAGGNATNSGSGPLSDLAGVLALTILVSAVAAIASLVVRFYRSRGDERQQLKWFLFAAAVLVASFAVLVAAIFTTNSTLTMMAPNLFLVGFLGLPLATGIAILRYRLYDIDIIISRTLVYGALAAFISAVYVGIVVGVGTLVGSGGKPNLVLSIVATAIVAVAFQPVRERLQKIANRIVYGNRATPYEVLSQFSERVAESYAADDVLPRMARVLAEGTGAETARVWLRTGSAIRPAATWPEDGTVTDNPTMSAGIAVTGQLLPVIPEIDRAVPVRHQGELLGALTVTKRRGESLTPVEEKLLTDLAAQAGLVLKNVGLTAELLARLDQLRASRQRLVAAQDEERRRLERNLHDGAQQNLVALKIKLGLAEVLAAKDPAKSREVVAQLMTDADEALETLRDLARGIYPPLLADRGLTAALESQARKATLPVTVRADGIQRYPQEIEAAVYFCVLEALQNVQKYARARTARVELRSGNGQLEFAVMDEGAGFDAATVKPGSGLTNMRDRLDALGGTVEVTSTPGHGTSVLGRLPVVVTPAVVEDAV